MSLLSKEVIAYAEKKGLTTDEVLAFIAKTASVSEKEKFTPYIKAKTNAERYLANPVLWGKDRLNEFYWSKQREILQSVADNRLTAVQSCHQVGKSMSAARAACWWIENHPVGETFVVSTAPTGPQVKAILWREIGKAHKKGNLVGHTNTTEWYIGEEMVAFGRKPNDYEPTAFQGIHARYVLVIIDEASGIPETLWDAASTLATNPDSRILAIGNPDDASSHFAKVCEPNTPWHKIRISAFDSPNFTDEEVPDELRHVLISPEWTDEKRLEWGEDDPRYISKILGLFPKDDEDGTIKWSWLVAADRDIRFKEIGEVSLGVDVGAGSDRSVIQEKRGPVFTARQWTSKHKDPERLTGEIVAAAIECNPDRINIDATGWGWGVVGSVRSSLRDLGMKAEVNGVMVGEKAQGEIDRGDKIAMASEHYVNLKAQMWWDARDAIRKGEWDVHQLSEQARNEMSKPRYGRDNRGRIKIEGKEELIKRIGYSPDIADAVLLAAHVPIVEEEADPFAIFVGSVGSVA